MKMTLTLLLAWTALVGEGPALAENPAEVSILVAYHSATGNTKALGKALVEGMKTVPGVKPVFRSISEVTDEDIQAAEGLLVGTPVYWASLHSRVKEFLDRVGAVLDQQTHGEGRTAGAFCTGGAPSSGNELARIAILSAFMNMRFVIVGGVETDGFGNLGSAATTGPADPGLSESELATARLSGARFARITAQLRRGLSEQLAEQPAE